MSLLILTGPAAAGKNTIGSLLAPMRPHCALIDVDLIRAIYTHPHKAPWEGEQGIEQQVLGVHNACLLAQNFIKHDIDVVILDVIVDSTAQIYKTYFPQSQIILLMPSYQEAFQRFSNRHHTISEHEFKLVYDWQASLTQCDQKIDNTTLTAQQVANTLNRLF